MKKFTLLLLVLILSLMMVACNKEPAVDGDSQASQNTETQDDTSQAENNTEFNTESNEEDGIVKPLDSTIDIKNLSDGTYSIALEKGDFYVDENGETIMVVTLYDYGLYEVEDMQNLQLGDTILILEEEVVISSLEQSPLGNIIVNGGIEMGGYDFTTKDGKLYFIIGYSDMKAYYEIGLVTLPVSDDFTFTDELDMGGPKETYTLEDCLAEDIPFFFSFTENNTTITVEGGYVVEMQRIYTP